MKGLLKTWLWMLALSLAVGLAIGTCVRRESERPATYIGDASPARREAPCREAIASTDAEASPAGSSPSPASS